MSNNIYVDVDGTLVRNDVLNVKLVDWLKRQKSRGYVLTLWSMRGVEYAKAAATKFGVTELFSFILSKPNCIVDDCGWRWTRFSPSVSSFHLDLPLLTTSD